MNKYKTYSDWAKALRKEQLYYPSLKFVRLDKTMLIHYFETGFSPVDALNDILTL